MYSMQRALIHHDLAQFHFNQWMWLTTQFNFFLWSYEHDRTRRWTKTGECVDSNLNTSDWPLHCRYQQTCLWLVTLLPFAKMHCKIIWRFPKQKIHWIVRQIYFVIMPSLQRKLILDQQLWAAFPSKSNQLDYFTIWVRLLYTLN